jgi:hypothetical protein
VNLERRFVEPLPHVAAQLNYRIRDPRALNVDTRVYHSKALPFDRRTVEIRDARPIAATLNFESDGFCVRHSRTAVRDFFDPRQIEDVYLAECVSLIKEVTGAHMVLTFRWKWRSSAADKRQDVLVEDPPETVHVDYTEETVRRLTRDIAGDVEAERLLRRRFALINIWRPITTVEEWPLAVCDPSTVKRDDLNPVYIATPPPDTQFDPPLVGLNAIFNAAHRWYYFPRLKPDEALVFRLCDSDHGRPQFTAHSPFEDPTSPPDARPRESFEMRTIAFYPD